DRMARNTKQPEVLRGLFQALGNDPFLIAECLASPVLAERLLRNYSAHGQERLDSCGATGESPRSNVMPAANVKYTLPTISDTATGCTPDTWTATSTTNAPAGRYGHTAIWTGNEMIIWGGTDDTSVFNTGGRYNPGTDSWTGVNTANAPSDRYYQTAVWTGSEMIVWGGYNGSVLNSGGRYNPGTDSWTATSTTNAAAARYIHTAVWTGSEMIVWSGIGTGLLNTGGKYN